MPEYDKMIFAKNLKALMEEKKINSTELGKIVGAERSTVCDWLHGRKLPRMDKVETMSIYFGVKKSQLIEPQDGNEEEADYARIYARDEVRVLLSALDGASKEDIEKATAIIKALKGDN